MFILRLSDKSCLVHHHLIKNLSHVQRMLSYIKYAVNLTKYSLLLSTWLTLQQRWHIFKGWETNTLSFPRQGSRSSWNSKHSKNRSQPQRQHIRNSAITLHSRSTYIHQLLGCDCHPTAVSKRNGNSHLKYSIYPDMKERLDWCWTRKQFKSKTKRCLKVTHTDKGRNYNFLSSNQKEHKVLLHRRQRSDSIASALCSSCQCSRTWYWWFQPSAEEWEQ